MFVVDTHTEANESAWLIIRRTRGTLDVLAQLTVELGCTEDSAGNGFCLLNPPTWMYRVGGHHKYSLGGSAWHLGQWAYGRTQQMPEVHRHEVSRGELEAHFDWWPADEDRSACG